MRTTNISRVIMTWGIKQNQNARRKKNKSIWEYNRWENKNDFDENKMNKYNFKTVWHRDGKY